MSTLVAQTISNGTVSTSSANVIQGSARAWVNFNANGVATIRTSYNVSSVTRSSTGRYVVNFTTVMPDANYCYQMCARDTDNGMGVPTVQADPAVSVTTSSLPIIYNYPPNQVYYDADTITVTVFSS
jgi:chitodextrinase